MADLTEARDVDLMRRLSTGDEGAFVEFYRRHQAGLFRFAAHMTGGPESAADVVQETFLTLIRHAGKFDEERGAPAAFLFGIARNHIRKLHEKEGRYVALVDETANGASAWNGETPQTNGNGHHAANRGRSETVLDRLEHAEIIDQLHQAVLTLPDHYREPVTLCDFEGKSYDEAAALLECPVGTVRSRLNRARSILLEKLKPSQIGGKALSVRSGEKI